MAECYHEDAVFSDPVFENLKGSQITDMWSLLCLQAKTLEIKYSNIQADETSGQASWTARYPFGKSHREVFNRIEAKFEFLDGKIIRHIDHFDMWKWCRMALGPLGFFMGWHSVVQVNIRRQAMKNLTNFTSKRKTT